MALTEPPQFYVDHDWMMDMGEACRSSVRRSTWRTSAVSAPVGDLRPSQPGQAEVAVRYLTIHNKWAGTPVLRQPVHANAGFVVAERCG